MPLYSYSRIGCFENCPRQYKFRYIEKPDIEKPEGVEAFLGTMVHETLEQCYRLAQRGKVMSLEELLTYYREKWAEKLPANLRIVKSDMTAEDYLNIGIKSLEMYYARYAPFDQETTLGLERRVVFALDSEGRYKLQGYIDRLTRDSNGRLRIQDYKTSGSLPTQPEADADSQLALYQIAVQEMWPDNNGIELVWHYVQFDTTLVSHRSPEQLDELRQTYIDKIRSIERAEELGNFPTNETNLCNWCEYNQLCPAKGGPGVVADDQATITPLSDEETAALVDEYIAADTEKKRLDKRLKAIRKDLKGICQLSGHELHFKGSGTEGLYMTLSTIAKLPTKSVDEAAVERMREMIVEAGLEQDFLTVDVAALQKRFTAGKLPETMMKELDKIKDIIVQDRLRIKNN